MKNLWKRSFVLRILRWSIEINSFIYKIINSLAVRAEGGVHPKHRLTKYHEFFVDNVDPKDRVLDIGCGNGFVASKIAKKVRWVTGIDINRKNINFAKKQFQKDNVEYIVGDATEYPFKEKYDAIVLSNILEHIKDRPRFLKKIRGLAKKFLIRVPMIDRDWLTLYKRELSLDYFSDPSHHVEYTLEIFRKELQEAGLIIEKAFIRFGEIWAVVKKK